MSTPMPSGYADLFEQLKDEVERAQDYKNHQLPLARIKKIMKSDEDVRVCCAGGRGEGGGRAVRVDRGNGRAFAVFRPFFPRGSRGR